MVGPRSASTSSLYAVHGQSVRLPACGSGEPSAPPVAPLARRRKHKIAATPITRLRQIVLVALACALSILLTLASNSASHAAAPSPSESRYRPTGPAPRHMPCPAAAPRAAADYAPANGCVSGLPVDATIAQLARQDTATDGDAAAQEPMTQHPGARHPEAVLYEIRDGERQILVIDLWCLPTIQKPIGVRTLC